jgi:hypothetical protein
LDLDKTEQARAVEAAGTRISNPFHHWLRLKGELMLRDLPNIDTDLGIFSRFIEEPA